MTAPPNMVRMSVAMPVDCRETLLATAQVLGRSPSWVLRMLITHFAATLTRNYSAAMARGDE